MSQVATVSKIEEKTTMIIMMPYSIYVNIRRVRAYLGSEGTPMQSLPQLHKIYKYYKLNVS